MSAGRRVTKRERAARRPGQLVIAETVTSANGKLRASGREKSVVSLRLSRSMLLDLDVYVAKKIAEAGGKYVWPRITRTTVIEGQLAQLLATAKGKSK